MRNAAKSEGSACIAATERRPENPGLTLRIAARSRLRVGCGRGGGRAGAFLGCDLFFGWGLRFPGIDVDFGCTYGEINGHEDRDEDDHWCFYSATVGKHSD